MISNIIDMLVSLNCEVCRLHPGWWLLCALRPTPWIMFIVDLSESERACLESKLPVLEEEVCVCLFVCMCINLF